MSAPLLHLHVNNVEGSPWHGLVTPEFDGKLGTPIRISETADPQQYGEVRWYIERFLDFPEGGNLIRARA
ncbi:MAG TPA: hypothetical protein VKB86_18455, partial [Pyrinomonadaceae bacterium]|nr:hypothetical protein [Pyrinomonadaceae bacterium]